MTGVYFALLLVSAVCFVLAAVTARPRTPLTWKPIFWVALGLLAWVLVPLIQEARALN